MKKNNIIFLYAELTPYLLGSLSFFKKHNPEYGIIVYYNSVFPNVDLSKYNFKFISKNNFSSKKDFFNDVKKYNPLILLVSGRMEKFYLYVSKKYKSKIKVVCLFDTIYTKSFSQFIKKNFSNFLYKPYFDIMWGTGSLQEKFALDIGYKPNMIKNGFYVADNTFFKKKIKPNFKSKTTNFLFIGRLVKVKNIIVFAKILDEINILRDSNHTLGIIGKGILLDELKKYKCVNYLGLKTQNQILKIVEGYNAFCLPSIYEPWGVVAHEMTAIGLPVLISNKCGSSHDLVKDGYNGFVFNPKSNLSIRNSIDKFLDLSYNDKIDMSIKSKKLANNINHSNWNQTLLSLINL